MYVPTLSTRLAAVLCSVLLVPAPVTSSELAQEQQASASQEQPAKIPADQMDSLVAPIALYPDPLLAQTLAASTYPLELIQLQQWLDKHKDLKDKALTEAVQKQPWDPSVQSMAAFPDVVKLLANDVQWTTDLGNAFLAQQNDVMEAVQRMRKKAQDKGNLKTTEQQKVETKVVESKQVIVIEQANPQVVYVPSYNPTVVYGPPPYPYPPVAYPPPGYYAAGVAISFGVGMMVGAAMNGGWGWNCGWGGNNNITINNNNNYNRNTNINGGNRTNVSGNRGGNNTWQHNPQHRGGTPYADRNTANRYGGTARGDSAATRQANARQRQQQGGVSNRASGGAGDRAADRGNAGDRGGNRANAGTSDRNTDRGDRGSNDRGGDRGSSDRGRDSDRGGGDRGGGANRGGGGDRVGDRSVSSGSNASSRGAFGGSSSSGSSARQSSSRGASSMGGGSRGSRGGGGGGRRR